MTKKPIPTPEERHDNFVKKYMNQQKAKRSEEIRSKAGRKPVPESQRREKNVIKTYVSDEELEIIRDFIGDRSASDVVRTLVLEAAQNGKEPR